MANDEIVSKGFKLLIKWKPIIEEWLNDGGPNKAEDNHKKYKNEEYESKSTSFSSPSPKFKSPSKDSSIQREDRGSERRFHKSSLREHERRESRGSRGSQDSSRSYKSRDSRDSSRRRGNRSRVKRESRKGGFRRKFERRDRASRKDYLQKLENLPAQHLKKEEYNNQKQKTTIFLGNIKFSKDVKRSSPSYENSSFSRSLSPAGDPSPGNKFARKIKQETPSPNFHPGKDFNDRIQNLLQNSLQVPIKQEEKRKSVK